MVGHGRIGRRGGPSSYRTVDHGERGQSVKDRGTERRPSGELEASVLGVLWAAEGPLTAALVQEELPMPLARTTVATILARLQDKGAVVRERAGRGYAYSPAQDSHGLTARRMHHELDKDSDREVVLARFVSQLGPDDERVLRELLEAGDQ
jgi:predicted transcriptional regulator